MVNFEDFVPVGGGGGDAYVHIYVYASSIKFFINTLLASSIIMCAHRMM